MAEIAANDGLKFDPDNYAKVLTVDASDRATQINIVVGGKGTYGISLTYTGTNKTPDTISNWTKQ